MLVTSEGQTWRDHLARSRRGLPVLREWRPHRDLR